MQAFRNLLGLVHTRMQNFSSTISSAWVARDTHLQDSKFIQRHFPSGTWNWKLTKSWEDRLNRAIFQNKTKLKLPRQENLSTDCYIPGLCKISLVEGRCFLENSSEILNCCAAWNRRDIWTDRPAKASIKFKAKDDTRNKKKVTPKHKQFVLLMKPHSWCQKQNSKKGDQSLPDLESWQLTRTLAYLKVDCPVNILCQNLLWPGDLLLIWSELDLAL